MHEAPTAASLPALRPADQPALPVATQPELAELFDFMAEAELRFDSLRMRIVDKRVTANGDEVETHDVWLRHPGHAKVVSSRGTGVDRNYDVWVADGEKVHTYDATGNTMTERRLPARPVGAESADLPPFSRIYLPVTTLPAESLADTFVHPRGFCHNVLMTGVVYRRGTQQMANGREAVCCAATTPGRATF